VKFTRNVCILYSTWLSGLDLHENRILHRIEQPFVT